jgi:hypothetical protein
VKTTTWLILCLLPLLLVLAGCSQHVHVEKTQPTDTPVVAGKTDTEDPDIKTERAKLSPEDRQLVDAQDFCAISNESRLGGMGAPIKVMIKDQPVFLCCKGCQKEALADPDKTLAKVEALKAKKKDSEAPK